MATITVRQVDDDVKRDLKIRAARNGHSMEEEVRQVLRASVGRSETAQTSELDREARIRAILSHGRRLEEPFDLKAFSDALSDGRE